jgi:catechol 2,3-dioxygenase-like lactoylglutathione lyase family enzyme
MPAPRPHLALTVSDVERSIPFYEALFGVAPVKTKPGYAKFSIAQPALNFTLNQGQRTDALGALDHAGIQVASTDDVLAAKDDSSPLVWLPLTRWTQPVATHARTRSGCMTLKALPGRSSRRTRTLQVAGDGGGLTAIADDGRGCAGTEAGETSTQCCSHVVACCEEPRTAAVA